jgi:hypothetical protein
MYVYVYIHTYTYINSVLKKLLIPPLEYYAPKSIISDIFGITEYSKSKQKFKELTYKFITNT